MTEPLLLANVGAEAGERAPETPAARSIATLWRSLFEAPPLFEWLPRGPGAVAWLNTPAAESEARAAGRALIGAAPDVVARVHDKAFAHGVAEREGLVPACLRGASAVLSPETLRAADAVAALEARLASFPAWAQERFTLKPRWGTSGRGRVAGSAGRIDTPELRGALPRLAERGGALLEPWLDRCEDLAAAFWLAGDGALRLIGTTRQLVDASGLYRGARGSVDARGRVSSGSTHDEAVRAAAALVANAAAAEGYHGPGSVDALSFRTPAGEVALRPCLELNARWTVGIVAVGLVRRRLARLRDELGLAPGGLAHFALLVPGRAAGAAPAGSLHVPLADGAAELWLARDSETLDALLAPRG